MADVQLVEVQCRSQAIELDAGHIGFGAAEVADYRRCHQADY